MPHRTIGLGIGILGLLAVAFLILLGRNLDQAAGTGPRWKRRLLVSGILLLGALGLMPNCSPKPKQVSGAGLAQTSPPDEAPPHPTVRTRARPAMAKTHRSTMEDIADLFHRAQAVITGKNGSYPFDREGKRKLLRELDNAMIRARRLAASHQISAADADLLVTELTLLKEKVFEVRSSDTKNMTCYEIVMVHPRKETRQRLLKRLQVLQHASPKQRLDPRVVRLVQARLEKDLADLDKLAKQSPASAKDRSLVAKIRRLWKHLTTKRRVSSARAR